MIQYNYNKETFQIETRPAYKNPMEEGYMVTVGWTLEEPPEKDGFYYVNNGDNWVEHIDNRGTYYDTETGQKKIINNPNEDISTLTKKERPDGFYKWDSSDWVIDEYKVTESKINEIKQEFILNELNGFFKSETLGCDIDGRQSDVINIQAICMLPIEYRPNFYKNYNNEIVKCDQADFDKILIEIITYRLEQWNLKEDKLGEV